MGDEFITIARVRKTQGRRGEISAELHTDFPERFKERRKIFFLADDGQRRELELESFWSHKGRMVLKFAGIDSLFDAESLVGGELQIRRCERARLDPGSAYVSDLVGSIVYDGDHEIGQVINVEFGAGEAPLLIIRAETSQGIQEKQYEIPFAEAYLKSVKVDRKQIRMLLPEGMLDVNAPLKAEEKQQWQQRRRPRRLVGRRA